MENFLETLLSSEMVMVALTSAIVAGLGYVTKLVNKKVKDQDKADKINAGIEAAVWYVFENHVKPLKEAKAKEAEKLEVPSHVKLTPTEAESMRSKAEMTARERLLAQGIDLSSELSQAVLRQAIESAVQGFKNGTVKITPGAMNR